MILKIKVLILYFDKIINLKFLLIKDKSKNK